MRKQWLIAFAAAGLSFGQPRVQITEADRIAVPADDPVPAIIERLPSLALGQLSDNTAKAMLDASSSGSKSFLRWSLGEPIGATTLTDREMDILVAHWAKTGNDALATDVWLWDDPIGCYFLLPFSWDVVNDRSRLEKLFESLLVWWEPDPEIKQPDDPTLPRIPHRIRVMDGRAKGLSLAIWRIDGDGLFGTGLSLGEPGFSTSRLGRGRPSVELYRKENRAWIAIRLGKPWMETPRDMYEIPERFPLLRNRVAEWSMNQLLREYSRPLINDPAVGSQERDRIILAELLTRDMGVAQLQQLLHREPAIGRLRTYESGMVVELVVRAGKSKQFEPVLREEINRAMQSPNEYLGNMLSRLRPVMDVNVSDLAVECAGLGVYVAEHAVTYLESRGQTLSVYNSLRDQRVQSWLIQSKERALAAIQKRLR